MFLVIVQIAFLVAAQGSPAAASGPDLAEAQYLLGQGRAGAAFAQLAPFEATFAGDVQFDYLLARAAMDTGRPQFAARVFARILASQPSYVAVRLEYAQALGAAGRTELALIQINRVLAISGVPPSLANRARDMRAAFSQDKNRTTRSAFVEFGLGYDTNVNSAGRDDFIALPGGIGFFSNDPLALRRGDTYQALELGGAVSSPVAASEEVPGALSVFLQGAYEGRYHRRETIFDTHEGTVAVGASLTGERARATLSATGARLIADDQRLRDSVGLRGDLAISITPTDDVSLSVAVARRRFARLHRTFDYDEFDVAVGWSRSVYAGKGLLSAFANLGYEAADGPRADGDQVLTGLAVSAQVLIERHLGYVVMGVQRELSKGTNPIFRSRRRDTFWSATAGINFAVRPGWTLNPSVSWSENKSSSAADNFERVDALVTLRWEL